MHARPGICRGLDVMGECTAMIRFVRWFGYLDGGTHCAKHASATFVEKEYGHVQADC